MKTGVEQTRIAALLEQADTDYIQNVLNRTACGCNATSTYNRTGSETKRLTNRAIKWKSGILCGAVESQLNVL